MKKHWLTAIIMAALLLVQAVVICGGALAEGEEHEHKWGEWEGQGTYHERHCTAEGCDGVETANHDVPCTICGYGVQPEHTFSDEWSYDKVDHWHACTEEGCNWTKDQAEHDWTDWEGVATGHKRECKVCHYVESVDHDKDVYNAGKCEICGFTMHGAQDEWKNDENTHWHECKFAGCEEKFNEEQHVIIGGKCKCGYEQKHEFSDEWSSDETHHWHACTVEGCGWTYDEAEHTWGEWIAEGTFHERECTVCHRVQHENHDLTDGKCDICGFTMHGAQDEWKNDEHTHWHGCKFDGCKDKFDENEHDLVNGVCRVCGYGKIDYPVYDDVQPIVSAPLPPQTGDASYLAIGIGMIAAALCIALRKRQSN